MAVTKKQLRDNLRAKIVEDITKFLADRGDEVLPTATNKFCFPCVDAEGNEEFCVVTVTIPTGSRDGEAYDGYGEAEAFKMAQAEKAEKAKEAAEAKAKKIERDKAQREAKAKAKAEHEAKKAEQ